MEEITHIGQRTTCTVHETDRTSSDLLAQVYQHLASRASSQSERPNSVQHGVTMTAESVSMQEVKV